MQIIVDRKSLVQALKNAGIIIKGKSAMPILSHVMLSATDEITITSTDLQTAIIEQVEGRILEQGQCTLPAKDLQKILTKVKSPLITIESPETDEMLTEQSTILAEYLNAGIREHNDLVEQCFSDEMSAVFYFLRIALFYPVYDQHGYPSGTIWPDMDNWVKREFVEEEWPSNFNYPAYSVKITDDRGFQIEFQTPNVQEFPPVPDPKDSQWFDFSLSDLMLISGAKSTDETRCNLEAVCYRGSEFIATDGHRMHRTFSPLLREKLGDDREILFTGNLIDVYRRLAKLYPDPCLTLGNETIGFHGNGIDVIARKVEGEYPDTDRIIPKSLPSKVVHVQAPDFREYLESCVPLINSNREGSLPIVLNINSHSSFTEIEAGSSVTCQRIEKPLSVEIGFSQKDDLLRIGFNLNYLIEATTLSTADLKISLYDASKAILVQGNRGTAVIMPLRLGK